MLRLIKKAKKHIGKALDYLLKDKSNDKDITDLAFDLLGYESRLRIKEKEIKKIIKEGKK